MFHCVCVNRGKASFHENYFTHPLREVADIVFLTLHCMLVEGRNSYKIACNSKAKFQRKGHLPPSLLCSQEVVGKLGLSSMQFCS